MVRLSKHNFVIKDLPTINEPLSIGYKSIYKYVFDIDFRYITTFYLNTGNWLRYMYNEPKPHHNIFLINDKEKGFLVLRPLETITRNNKMYLYYYNPYSHVKIIDYLSLIFLEK